MKAHAVPQDIMNLEFKLFGNFLSLREFIFIAVGVALAWFFYFLMQKGILPGILAIPAILLFGLGGIMIGLVPIQDRPLDQWIVNYIAAIRKPTQRVWKKPGFQYAQAPDGTGMAVKNHVVTPPTAQTTSYFTSGVQKQPKRADTATIEVEKNETAEISRIQQTIEQIEQGKVTPSTTTAQNPAAAGIPEPAQPQTTAAPSPQQPAVQQTTNTQPAQPQPIQNPVQRQNATQQSQATVQSPQPSTQPKTLEPRQVQHVASPTPQPVSDTSAQQPVNNIEKTTAMPAATQSKMIRPEDVKQDTPAQAAPAQPTPQQSQPHPSAQPAKTLIIDDNNIKDYATSITGLEPQKNTINIVVKDANGLILPGVVCVIKNPNGDPVRAAISNVLGQVLNNVPLKDDTYAISLSKQGYVFPEITRTLKGKVYQPIEIRSL